MCARADYREGFRVLTVEWRRLVHRVWARWRGGPVMPGAHRPAGADRAG